MRRREGPGEWRLHQTEPAATTSSELSTELSDLSASEGPQAAQLVREEVVDGIRRAELLRRIRAHFAAGAQTEHLRYTRRAVLELQGRRHASRHAESPPA